MRRSECIILNCSILANIELSAGTSTMRAFIRLVRRGLRRSLLKTGFLDWSMYLTSTRHQTPHPHSTGRRRKGRNSSRRPSPMQLSCALRRSLGTRTSSSTALRVSLSRILYSRVHFTSFGVSGWPIWWKLNHGRTEIRPVHVRIL